MADIVESVKEYYGKRLKGSGDLKSGACCCAEKPPAALRKILPMIADEITKKFYGCGSPLALAFLAKAVWNLPTTRALVEFLKANRTVRVLCGWERAAHVPHESTFSRAFERFARDRLPERLHGALTAACLMRLLE